jgi:phage-related protein
MLANTVVLKNLDPKSLHQQIVQLEAIQREMAPDDSNEANTVKQTVKLLHMIEDELRRQARIMHPH